MLTRKGIILPARARTLALVACAIAVCATVAFASPAFAATYDPLNVISYDVWRASNSMTAADIQSFLDAQTGPLKTYKTYDYHDTSVVDSSPPTHHSTAKTAARIIWDAARAWNLNPKIILATLQKEQSLLTVSNSANAARLYKAMGCGVYGAIDPKTGLTTNRSPGFGHQIWDGARVLSTYETTYHWYLGATRTVTAYKYVDATKTVDGQIVHYDKRVSYSKTIAPKNASTFALYIYTPYYPQKLVWDVYTRYFGDPQSPARLQPVYRFRNRTTGAYYYTTSEGTRYSLISKSAHEWSYGGVSFTFDTSSTANTAPLYRLQDSRTHRYYYTTSAAKRTALLKVRPVRWRSAGTVGNVSKVATEGAIPVYLLQNKQNLGMLFTQNLSTKKSLTTGHDATFYYRGIAFYLGRSKDTTTPVGP